MIKNIFLTLIGLGIFLLGATAGHFHGKSTVLEALFEKSEYMTINPVALDALR